MIELDGSYLEGGGQIVRTALALSTITQKPFEVTDIRKGRPNPGLKNQHLFCIKALEELCNAKTGYAELGSTRLRFIPGKIKPQTISIDIGTAGSITLLLQSLLIPSIFANKKVRLKITGGTDVSWSPQFHYLTQVILPHLRKYADIEPSLLKRGYYPKGNGKVDIKIKPKFTLQTIKEAPKTEITNIAEEQIGLVIGGGGKTIKKLQEDTQTVIAIEQDGTVIISGEDSTNVQRAVEIIKGMTREVKPGEIFEGKVEEIAPYGAFVEILPGKTGLLHISEIADGFVESVEQHLSVGQEVKVKVIEVSRDGKYSLSIKALNSTGDSKPNKRFDKRNRR